MPDTYIAEVADGQFRRSVALPMLGLKDLEQDFMQGVLLHTEEVLEHYIDESQSFRYVI